MTDDYEDLPPPSISHLVRERTEARAARDWPRADALKAAIEAEGWRVVDHGSRTSVRRAAPRDVEVAGELRYGSSASVPSRLDEPATAPFSVVLVAGEEPERFRRLLAAVRATAPAGSQIVVAANDPSAAQERDLAAVAAEPDPPEIVRTAARLGHATALNAALRRTAGAIVVLADGTAQPAGDAYGPLADALADPEVAVAGGFGLASDDDQRLDPAALEPSTAGEVAALEGAWLAFRRDDYRELGPLDERFAAPGWLDVWWSLRLRAGPDPAGMDEDPAADQVAEPPADGPEAEPADEPELVLPAPRRAVRLDLPLETAERTWPPDRSHANRRNMYRVMRTFGWRGDLVPK